jgi:lipopolysaccharide export system protein LptC
MNERFATWFPLLLLALLAALTFWIDRTVGPPTPTPDGTTRHDPDFMAEKLFAIRMTPGGQVKHTLFAEKMVHYPDDDTTHLASPVFTSYATANSPVTITAKQGLVSSEGENVYFKDNVRAARAPYDNKSELVVRTSYLHIVPDDNIAKTDQPVTISDANITVDAIGLELNNETRILKLHSRVRGTYEQNKK